MEEQINKAITAHGLWKARLRDAISGGKSIFTVEDVKKDTKCEFGKWLHEEANQYVKTTDLYKSVVKQHADFHAEAARILQLALSGKKVEAETALLPNSKFATFSASLVLLLMEWKKKLK